MSARQSGGPSGAEALEHAYGELVWSGWCTWDIAGEDDPEQEAFLASIRERAGADGLRAHENVLFDRSPSHHEIGDWIVPRAARRNAPARPEPVAWPARRDTQALETAWGDVLARARVDYQEPPPERESRAEHGVALTRYLNSSYLRRLWIDIRRRLQKRTPLGGSFGRRW